MKYYRLHLKLGDEIGEYPQVQKQMNDTYNIYDKDSSCYINLSKATKETIWPMPVMHGKAKKTDLVSTSLTCVSCQLLISDKLCNIIQQFASSSMQFMETKLITRTKKEDKYWYVNPYESLVSFIDCSNTKFAYTENFTDAFEEVKFSSVEEYTTFLEKNKKDALTAEYGSFKPLSILSLALKENISSDFFYLERTKISAYSYFVSERLKAAIEEAGCTGIIFTGINELNSSWFT